MEQYPAIVIYIGNGSESDGSVIKFLWKAVS
jgi:hypothetical protein